MLGDGTGDRQTQFNIHFNDYANHVHPNVLAATLYGFGKELIGGIRYSRIPTRNFSRSTLADNTVVVNGTSQYRSTKQEGSSNAGHLFNQGILSLYEPGLKGIEASEVYSKWAYPGTVDRYQRLNILNTIDPDHPYLIDLFKVTGGKTHEYVLHGSTQFDETAEASFPLQKIDKPYPLLPDNVTWTDPVSENDNRNWYGLFRDVSTGKSPGKWDVTYKDAGGSGVGTRIWMADDGKSQVYLGKSPHSYRDKLYDDIYQFWRPSLIVKREDPNQTKLDSLFVGVVEPLHGESAISGIERLPLKEANPEHVALSVKFKDGREDVILVNMNQPGAAGSASVDKPVATADGNYELEGRIGIAVGRSGVQTPYLIAGGSLRYGGDKLTLETPSVAGTITGAVRKAEGADVDALITPELLPEGDALKGKWLSLNFGTYKVVPDGSGKYPSNIKEQTGMSEMFRIDRVERRGGLTYIVTAEDHALSIQNGKTSELLRPKRTFENVPAFRIDFSRTKDVTPPVTAASAEGSVNNGWYTDAVAVKLQAADDESGVASTFYKLTVTGSTYSPTVTQSAYGPGDGWLQYDGPIAITRDGKYELRYYSTDKEGNAEEEKSLAIARDTAPPGVKAISPEQGGRYPDSQDLTVQLELNDPWSGPDDGKTALQLDGKPVQRGAVIPLYTLPLGPHSLTVKTADMAGNTGSATISFTTETSVSSLAELVARFAGSGSIDNKGIANSLLKKLEHGDIGSFVNEVRAQSGKHIAAEAAGFLLRDADLLLARK
nr:heparinase II/III family protein [Paenibacillus hamazuiensis]